jgi:hypothetical protein
MKNTATRYCTTNLKNKTGILTFLQSFSCFAIKREERKKLQLTRKMAKTSALSFVLWIACFTLTAMFVEAQLSHIGTSPVDAVGMPKLGPLPSGVIPAYTLDTVAYLSFRPNPIGVGQSLLVNFWTSPGTHHGIYMQGYTVTIQKPDGSTDVVGPMISYLGDCTAWFEYVPDEPGIYKLKFEHAGTYIPAGEYVDRPGTVGSANFTIGASMYYKPSSTDWQELTVQAEMVSSWPAMPLPTDYWTRPVNPVHRDWWPILGDYPWNGVYYYPNGRVLYPSNYRYTAYVQAPNTAHIVWKRVGTQAGLIGGQTYDYAISSSAGTPSIIYDGRCYQTVTKAVNGKLTSVWQCYDLRTGEVYWELTDVTPPTLIEYSPPTPDPTVAGASEARSWAVSLMYIGGGRVIKYNPSTGAVTMNVSIAPLTTGTYYMPEYALSVQNIGNSTVPNYRLINWTTAGSTTNFTARVMGNISWPLDRLEQADYDAGIAARVTWANPPGGQWCIGAQIWSVDLYTGKQLYYYTTNDTLGENLQKADSQLVVNRGRIAFPAHNRHWVCYDGRTARLLWKSEQTPYPWGTWWPYSVASYDFNETKSAIITSTYEGVYAIDWDDGKLLWRYTDPNPVPFEGPYDATPFFTGVSIADGKIYAYNGEHTPSLPSDRAWKLHCINATTGELIWKILNPMVPGAIADGYLTASNPYDGYMYVFGRGKSATTVTAEPAVIAKGSTVLVKGTVLDQSPGQAGTPCVSAASMETQMEYLHIQMPIDGLWHNGTITGVPVTLTAIGSDGSVYDLGIVTTNGYYGTFRYAWTPAKEDTYEILASFAGDDSYGSSTAASAITVGPAPETPGIPETITPVDNTNLLYIILVVGIIAIVLSLVAIFRKK